MTRSLTITPRGAFSLRESAEFGFGQRDAQRFDGVMRLAFVLDDLRTPVGVAVRQSGDSVTVDYDGTGDSDAVRRQVSRVLSLDHDARGFEAVGQRDPVVARLQAVAPGLRPPLFHSPYEAAVWAVLSARRPARQMAPVRQRLSEAHGTVFAVAGQELASLPTPQALVDVGSFPEIPDEKMARIRGVAEAALAGQLDVDRLVSLGPEAATADLQSIKGIGPFYASLVVIRATGLTDVLPVDEPMLRGLVTTLYRLDSPCTPERLAEIAEPWRPFRTWASVLIRVAGSRLPQPATTG
ncbi:MAG: DNA-3-methyladenine glycosylase [Nocardioidaceae bacterium]|jgi:DNA-3-methyladenine glycosylase II|nr:DNA-3-methyladenine glycosylase [Nocardioidaceae bacterium]